MKIRDSVVMILRTLLSVGVIFLMLYIMMNTKLYSVFYNSSIEYFLTYFRIWVWGDSSARWLASSEVAFILVFLLLLSLMLNYLLKRDSSYTRKPARKLTGVVYFFSIIAMLPFSLYPFVGDFLQDFIGVKLSFVSAFIAMSCVVTLHLILKYTSLQDELRMDFIRKRVNEEEVSKCTLNSYLYIIIIGVLSLGTTLGLYIASRSLGDIIELARYNYIFRVIIIPLILIISLLLVYLYIDLYS